MDRHVTRGEAAEARLLHLCLFGELESHTEKRHLEKTSPGPSLTRRAAKGTDVRGPRALPAPGISGDPRPLTQHRQLHFSPRGARLVGGLAGEEARVAQFHVADAQRGPP